MCGERARENLEYRRCFDCYHQNQQFIQNVRHYKETHVSHRSFASDLIDDQVE